MADDWDEVPKPAQKFTVIEGGKTTAENQAEVRKQIKDFCVGHGRAIHNPIEAAKLIKAAVFSALPKEEIDTLIEWCYKSGITGKGNLNSYYNNAVVEFKNAKKQELMVSGDWKVHLQQTPDGRSYLSNSHNINMMLMNDPGFVGHFRFDEFCDQTMIVQKPHWLDKSLLPRASNGMGWPLSDTIITALQVELQGKGLHHARDTDVDKCLATTARHLKYNSLTNWLDSLVWDGIARLNRWLVTYCGAESGLYSTLAGRWWLMSAVARAYNPGCKADYVLLLESPQGYKKSTLWMTVARRKEWYLEYTDDLNTADGRRQLRGKWIVALPELSVLNYKEVQHVKAFVTRQMENVRDIYEKYHRDHERSLVLCGDTNDAQYFSDPTGNRRYWPIKCGRIDIDGLDRDIDQIWAEAVHWIKTGSGGHGIWWPEIDGGYGASPQEVDICCQFNEIQRLEVEERYKTDPWEPVIVEYLLKGLSEFREVDKLHNATVMCQRILGIAAKDVGQLEQVRMGGILKRLGYVKQPVWLEKTVNGFKYVGNGIVKWRY